MANWLLSFGGPMLSVEKDSCGDFAVVNKFGGLEGFAGNAPSMGPSKLRS